MRFDMTALIFIALFIYIGHRRGLLLTAVGFVNSLISIAIAFLVVRPLSSRLIEWGLFSDSLQEITDRVTEGVQQYPTGLSSVLEGLGMPESWTRKILQIPDTSGQSVVDSTVNSIWQLVMGALVLILVLLARLLTPILNGVPVVGWLNRTGGLFLGLLWGLFTLWILIMVLTSFRITSSLVGTFMEDSTILAVLAEKDIFRSLLDTLF